MSHRFLLIAVSALVLGVGQTQAVTGVSGECIDGQHRISIFFETYLETAESGQGFILMREAIGFCEAPEFLPEEPISYTIVQGWPEFVYECRATVTVDAPLENVAYRYSGYFVAADGTQTLVPGACSEANGYGLVGCGNAPIARGELVLDYSSIPLPMWTIDVCDSFCWSESAGDLLTSEEVASFLGESWQEHIGRVVDVYGYRQFCVMAGDPNFEITGLEPSPSGACQAVPVEKHSFDRLKSYYR